MKNGDLVRITGVFDEDDHMDKTYRKKLTKVWLHRLAVVSDDTEIFNNDQDADPSIQIFVQETGLYTNWLKRWLEKV